MRFRLGLTGSIGMGKSTAGQAFADAGCALWDADQAVHRLYAKNGAAVLPIAEVFPEAVVNGAVSREVLREVIQADPQALTKLDMIVHPLVRKDREDFFEGCASEITVFDIPLLFETGSEAEMDAVACVTTSADEQRRRVLSRGTMNEAQFQTILKKQLPNKDKMKRADYIIRTDTMDVMRHDIRDILVKIRERK